MELKVIEFIKANPTDWKEKLSAKPYCLSMDEFSECGADYILFKYNQIESDMKEEICRECRGIIFRKSDWKLMCFPFKKFFNYGEALADKIDWKTAKVQEKVDGSIIKVWATGDGYWMVSTNGKINGNDATCPMGDDFMNLFLEGLSNHVGECGKPFFDLIGKQLEEGKHYTYIFEMVHPLTRVVIRYEKPDIRHIGTRNNDTLEEINIDLGIAKPKEYSFNSLEDVIAMAQTLPYSEEGYVVVDANWNRVKIKSPSYVAVHHLKNNGVITYKRIMELVFKGETQEFLAYFPEFTEYFNKAQKAFDEYVVNMRKVIEEIKDKKFETRKDYAMIVIKTQCPDYFFKVMDGKYTWEEFDKYSRDGGAEKLVKILNLKDEKVKEPEVIE